jgi:lipopolysaccharide export system protein LptA
MNKRFPATAAIPALLAVLLAAPAADIRAEDMSFSAGRVRSVFAEGSEQTVLEDGARVENDEIEITAETIRLYGENNRYIESRGGVFLRDKENAVELRAEYLSFDSDSEYLVLEGNAEFLDEGEDILVKATFIERQGDLAVFQINVQILREDLIARAEYVRFFEETGKLELSGFPVVNYRGDEYSAEVISIYTDTDEIVLEGRVEGRISDDGSDGPAGDVAAGDEVAGDGAAAEPDVSGPQAPEPQQAVPAGEEP